MYSNRLYSKILEALARLRQHHKGAYGEFVGFKNREYRQLKEGLGVYRGLQDILAPHPMAPEIPGLDIDPSSLLYRIQSVDFNTYLELYDAVELEKVVLRASKEDLAQQVRLMPLSL